VAEQFQTSELLHEVEWRKCEADPEYFFETYLKVRHPSRGRIPLILRDAQKDALSVMSREDKSLFLKARQVGFSTLMAAYTLWLAMFHDDVLIVMLSKAQREAQDLLRKAVYAYDQLPQWVKNRGPNVRHRTLQKLAFENESEIESLPSREDPARGKSVSLVIVDEWAFLENPEEAWASIEPIVDIGGRLIGLSTANGWGEFFHTQWVGARAGTNGFVPRFYPYDAVPERDDAWYESKKDSMLEWQLHQEYPRDEDEAFIKSGNVVFDTEMLMKLPSREPDYTGALVQLGESAKNFEFRPGKGGPLEVWEKPDPTHAYVVGADVAEGLEHGDFSSAHVVDVNTGWVVATWHGHIEADLFGEMTLAQLGWWYGTALVGVESNNHGLSTLQGLRRTGYQRIYHRRVLDEATRKQGVKLGWRTDRKTKPLMIDELARAVRMSEVLCLDDKTIFEMKTYVRDEKGQMSGSPHDDRVMSFALAVQMLVYAHAAEFKTRTSDYWTFEWWERQTPDFVEKNTPHRLGGHNVRKDRSAAY